MNTFTEAEIMESRTKLRNGSSIYSYMNLTPEILILSSYPPRECGIATYTSDLISALNTQFKTSFDIRVCAYTTMNEQHFYPVEVSSELNTEDSSDYKRIAQQINDNENLQLVVIQHEFGFFRNYEDEFRQFLKELVVPVAIVFHTVLPEPNSALKLNVQQIASSVHSIIVLTNSSKEILIRDYDINESQINVIAHGTHLVPKSDKTALKAKYELSNRHILSTFGFLSSGKGIENSLKALPDVIKTYPNVLFLIIGKTHPSVIVKEGEKYRNELIALIAELKLENHVRFINYFIPLPELLEYLQLSDIYLFSSKDKNQAVSGTFSYALSAGCPIISTPIAHARELLSDGSGVIIDFDEPLQLSVEILRLLNAPEVCEQIRMSCLHKMMPTCWENSAIAHAELFTVIAQGKITLNYEIPRLNLDHLRKMTDDFGMFQFSIIDTPEISSGYTLDDNARALIAFCQQMELDKNDALIPEIAVYFNFIRRCLQSDNYFLNYIDSNKEFTPQNEDANLEDANGRAVWALGYMLSHRTLLPSELVEEADELFDKLMPSLHAIYSSRAMAFIIKGLYYRNLKQRSEKDVALIQKLANRLVQMYKHERTETWEWYESYLTYANSVLPEALLCAWLICNKKEYREIARSTFDFLLKRIFIEDTINVISNKNWLPQLETSLKKHIGGEQPIDVAYTIIALDKFHHVFKEENYRLKIRSAFNWFQGQNHLHQIIYNPCTGGCYDGLEETYVNLNQGAESSISYLMARQTIEKTIRNRNRHQHAYASTIAVMQY